jgi:hypothetical protein
MVLTLQEITFMQLTPEQKDEIPSMVRECIERGFANRIQRAWRNSHVYRLRIIRCRIEAKEPITKRAIIYAIRHKFFEEKVSVADLTDFLHSYFHHNRADEYMADEDMLSVLSLFLKGAQNNAHLFYGMLWGMAVNSKNVNVELEGFYISFLPLSKEILLEIYSQEK